MKSFSKLFLAVIATASLFSAVSFSAPTPPASATNGEVWSLSPYTSQIPNPTDRIYPQPQVPSQSYAYPTNEWWGSVYSYKDASGYVSLKMSLGASSIKFSAAGYQLGAPVVVIRSNGDLGSQYAESNNGQTAGAGYLAIDGSTVPTFLNNGNDYISASSAVVKSFSDWSTTVELKDQRQLNSNLVMTTTFAKGSPFVWTTFSKGLYANLRLYPSLTGPSYYNSGTYINNTAISQYCYTTDGVIITQGSPSNAYYAVYAPKGSTFRFGNNSGNANAWWIDVDFPDDNNRYLVVAFLGFTKDITLDQAKAIFTEYRKYAYNQIINTEVSWKNNDGSIVTTFKYTTTQLPLRPDDITTDANQTVFELYPHQWRNFDTASAMPLNTSFGAVSYPGTLRGTMKVYTGSSFVTNYHFNGILPNLTYEVPNGTNQTNLLNYLKNGSNPDNSYDPGTTNNGFNAQRLNTYRRGKAVAKAANLIPIFQQVGDAADRNTMTTRLETELTSWYKGQNGRNFGYDSNWGGIVGSPYLNGDNFYYQNFNDHHFHNGYFIYASAMLAMFDPDFVKQYKGIVDLLIEDSYNPYKTGQVSQSFPFMRNFDVYEGHSWANGGYNFAAGDDGSDQESSSEAMNAWAAIYLWGIVTNNQDWINLGMYGYTTENEAIKEYYFDTHGETFPASYKHRGGVLYDGAMKYMTHWNTTDAQETMGIWILPLTPSMLYLGYDPSYAQWYYNKAFNIGADGESNQSPTTYQDIWLRYRALFDPAGALNAWSSSIAPEDGSSLSYSYHFINFFNTLGTVQTGYYAKDQVTGQSVPFTVMKSSTGQITYITYNNSINYNNVSFYTSVGGNIGTITVPPYTTIQTKDFKTFKYDSLRTMISSSNWHVIALNSYDDTSLTLTQQAVPAVNADAYYTFPDNPVSFSISPTTATTYIQYTGYIPDGFTPDEIQVMKYVSATNMVAVSTKAFTKVSVQGSTATVRIQADFSGAIISDKYVLAIPRINVTLGGVIQTTTSANFGAQLKINNETTNTSTTLNVNGPYSLNVLQGDKITVTPSTNTLYTFRPESFTMLASSTNVTQSFTAYAMGQISGTIKNNIGGGNVSVNLYVYDTVEQSTTVQTFNGTYAYNLIKDRNYIITPVADNFAFDPQTINLTISNPLEIQNITAFATSHVTGNIKNSADNTDLSATLNIYDDISKTTATQVSTGSYDFIAIQGKNYLVTPKTDGFTYEPSSFSFIGGLQDITQDFTGYQNMTVTVNYQFNSLAGQIPMNAQDIKVYDLYDKKFVDLSGATVTSQSNGGNVKVSLVSGREYDVAMPNNGKFQDYSFVNGSNQAFYLNAGSTVTLNFTAYPNSQVYTISGTVTAGSANFHITNSIIQNQSDGVIAFALLNTSFLDGYPDNYEAGSYSITLLKSRNYTIDFGGLDAVYSPKGVKVNTSIINNQVVNVQASNLKIQGTITNAQDGSTINDVSIQVFANALLPGYSNFSAPVQVVNGVYNFIALPGYDYNIIMSKANFNFAPVSSSKYYPISALFLDLMIPLDPNEGMQLNDYQLSRTTISPGTSINIIGYPSAPISGTIKSVSAAPLSATMQIYDTIAQSTNTVDASSGTYNSDLIQGRSYMITAQANQPASVSSAPQGLSKDSAQTQQIIVPEEFDIIGGTAAATKDFVSYPSENLSGNVTNNKDNSPVNMDLYVYDTVEQSTVVRSFTDGSYLKNLAQGRSYIITPETQNFIFEPASIALTPQASTTTSFTAFAVGSINGTIKNKQNNKDLAGTMYVYDCYLDTTTSQAFNGTYSQNVIEGRVYTFTPICANYVFDPANYTSTGTNQTVELVMMGSSLYSISGKLAKNGQPIANVDVTVFNESINSTDTVTTDAQGVYVSSIVASDSYLITPSTQDYKWTPSSLEFTSVSGNIENANFEVASKFDKVTPYPNPFKPSRGSTHITLSNIKSGDMIRIFNLSGEKVYEVQASQDGDYLWDVKNNSGNNIASGIYIFHVDSGGKVTKGKLAIER